MKRGRPPMLPDLKTRLREWFNAGLSDEEIAKRSGHTPKTITGYRHKLGLLKKRGRKMGYREPNTARIIVAIKEAFRKGETLSAIGRRLGLSRQATSWYAQHRIGLDMAGQRAKKMQARVREIRRMRAAGMTRKEAAAALGIHIATLSSLKKRHGIPKFKQKKRQGYHEKRLPDGRILVAKGRLSPSKLRWKTRARRIMEKKLGRKLKRNEHVVHKNGVLDDDRPGNLKVVPAGTTRTYYRKREIKLKERKKK